MSGAKKIAPRSNSELSVYVDSDAVRLYLAGKASCWHAGVCWLRQQKNPEVWISVWHDSKFNLIMDSIFETKKIKI